MSTTTAPKPAAAKPPAPAFAPPKMLWRASPNHYVGRHGIKNDMIVIHDTEGSYAGAVGTFLLQRGGRSVSAHFVLREDGKECTQMVALADAAWHVAAYNGRSTGIEMAGFFAKGFGEAEWDGAAWLTAYLCHRLDIPCQLALVSPGNFRTGICRHRDLGAAGGGHQDPTASEAVWAHFMTLAKKHYDAHDFVGDYGIR